MIDELLLDTHTWVWFELGELDSPPEALHRLRRAANAGTLYLAAISLHEVAYSSMRKRIELGIPLEDWLAIALHEPCPKVLPPTPAIAIASTYLPSGFHGDPGDRLIAATAIVHNLCLCTRDRALVRFGREGIYPFLEI